MTQETVGRVFAEIFNSGLASRYLTVIWHAGEPLVVGLDFFRAAFDTIARLTPPEIELRHSINTNGILISDEWCELFNVWNVNVGVSIDGPKDLHDENRRTRANRGTFDAVMSGVRTLRANQTPFYVISVLTRTSMPRADDYYDFCRDEGIGTICFNIEEVEGANRTSSMAGADIAALYTKFLRTFCSRVVNDGNRIKIREIENMLDEIVWPPDRAHPRSQLRPYGHLNIDWAGNFSTFSPELLGMKERRFDDFLLGNIWTTTLRQALDSPALAAMQAEIDQGVEMCRNTCEYFEVCGSGTPANKLFENGTFASTETMFCRLNVKAVADVALGFIAGAANAGSAPGPSQLVG